MSKDNNNIEDRFKDVFNGDIKDEGWNSPSSDTWPPIESKVNEAVPDRGSIWPAIWLLTIMLGSFASWHFYSEWQQSQQALRDVELQLKSCAEEKVMLGEATSGPKAEWLSQQPLGALPLLAGADDLRSTPTNTSPQTESSNTYHTVSAATNTQLVQPTLADQKIVRTLSPTVGVRSAITDADEPNSQTNDGSVSSLLSQFSAVVSPRVGNSSSRTVKSTLVEKGETVLDRSALGRISYLPAIGAGIAHEPMTAEDLLARPPIILPTEKKRSVYLSTTYASTSDLLRTSDRLGQSEEELIARQYSERGNSFELAVAFQLSKHWYVSAGVSYIQQRYSTEYDLSLAYEHSQEDHHGDHGTVHFQHSLPSVVGDLRTDLILSRALTSAVSESETVALDFDVRSRLQEVAVPISLAYYTGVDRSGFYVGATLQPMYVHSATSNVQHVLSHHTSIFETYSNAASEVSNINQVQLLTGVTTGYDYPLTSHLRVGVRASYLYSLTALSESATYRVAADRLSLGLSLTNRF